MKTLRQRLKEPSTYAGIGILCLAAKQLIWPDDKSCLLVTANPEVTASVVTVLAAVAGVVAAVRGEKPPRE